MSGPALPDRYRPGPPLGRGGFGAVHEAHDQELDRPVAIKLLEAGPGDPDLVARFAREARLTAQVSHPGVVRVYDHGLTPAGVPFIVYERLLGRDLGAVLAAEGPLDPQRVAILGRDLADALAAVHRLGVLHRDLKPSNVMIRPDGSAVLIDFGLAKTADGPKTSTGLIFGTPAYVAPEVWRGGPATPASDLFSLAATLYEVLFGVPYRPEGSVAEIGARLARGEHPAPPPGGEGRNPALVAALLRTLDPDPTRRPPDAATFARDCAAAALTPPAPWPAWPAPPPGPGDPTAPAAPAAPTRVLPAAPAPPPGIPLAPFVPAALLLVLVILAASARPGLPPPSPSSGPGHPEPATLRAEARRLLEAEAAPLAAFYAGLAPGTVPLLPDHDAISDRVDRDFETLLAPGRLPATRRFTEAFVAWLAAERPESLDDPEPQALVFAHGFCLLLREVASLAQARRTIEREMLPGGSLATDELLETWKARSAAFQDLLAAPLEAMRAWPLERGDSLLVLEACIRVRLDESDPVPLLDRLLARFETGATGPLEACVHEAIHLAARRAGQLDRLDCPRLLRVGRALDAIDRGNRARPPRAELAALGRRLQIAGWSAALCPDPDHDLAVLQGLAARLRPLLPLDPGMVRDATDSAQQAPIRAQTLTIPLGEKLPAALLAVLDDLRAEAVSLRSAPNR